jgi:sterol desaturase/sphingolipid hydroxylase (fatty acid hydroxylase superfamily)
MTIVELQDPSLLRPMIVLALLLLLLAMQRVWPRRGDPSPPRRRWRNLGLAALGSALLHLVVPASAVAFAAAIAARGTGVMALAEWPPMLEAGIAVLALDLAIYWQHRASHRLPWLWRIHRVHHTDTCFEVTLGVRFHPLEILLSLFYKFAVVAAIGSSPTAVALYEILLASFALWTHADLALAAHADRWLRLLVVTPDWHRVHHSVHPEETDSNYGNLLTLWDRVFASRTEQPRDGHSAMRLGLSRFREPPSQTLPALLRMPLDGVPIPQADDD